MHTTRLSIINVPLLTLCGKGIKQSQFLRETDDSESNFQPCKGKPNRHAWSTDESLPSNHWLLILVHGSVPLSPTTGNNHIPAPVVLQHKFNFLSLRESGGMSTCRAEELLGLPRTIFTACGYHFQMLSHRYCDTLGVSTVELYLFYASCA